MNRNDFINELKEGLKNEDYGTVSEIINDYEEYFAHGLLEGKTEEEICTSLGTPKQIIDNFIEQGIVENPNISKSEKEEKGGHNKEEYTKTTQYNIAGIIGLLFLNFFLITMIVLPVGGTIFGITLGFAVALIPCFIASIIMLVTGNIFLFFPSIAVSAFILVVLVGMYFLIKWIVSISKTYIKWNINTAKGGYYEKI